MASWEIPSYPWRCLRKSSNSGESSNIFQQADVAIETARPERCPSALAASVAKCFHLELIQMTSDDPVDRFPMVSLCFPGSNPPGEHCYHDSRSLSAALVAACQGQGSDCTSVLTALVSNTILHDLRTAKYCIWALISRLDNFNAQQTGGMRYSRASSNLSNVESLSPSKS
jgi:hypothetical protein